jgi:hypothetical protein
LEAFDVLAALPPFLPAAFLAAFFPAFFLAMVNPNAI